jgi:hypothetical protein
VKKTLAYVVTAILLGTVVMLFPVLMLYPSQVSTMRGPAPLPAPKSPPAPETYDEYMQKAAEVEVEAVRVAPFPLSLAYAGFIFMLGFVVGLGVSQYYKRRIA